MPQKGRNPPPVCVSPPRLNRFKVCIKLQDVYLFERNMHACMAVEGLFNKQVLFERMLGCMRMGSNGFAIVNPEDGGGLPSVEPEDPDDEEPNDEDDYDQVDEEYDPVEEETVLEAEVVTNADEQGENSDTENAAAKSKAAGITEGESMGVKKELVKTAGTTETPNTHESYGSMKTSHKGVDSVGSVSTNEVEEPINNTNPQESVSTTEDLELAKTTITDEDVVNNDANGTAEVGSNTAAKETQDFTITSPKTIIEPPKEGQDMGGSKKGDGDTVPAEPWKNAVAEDQVNEESNKTEAKSPATEETSEKISGEKTREPNGTPEEMVDAQNGGQGLVGGKEEISKRSRDLFDDEIVGVGTVEEL
ncbi:sodium/potassium/calcium exchanger 1-like [Hetaerina americana]|uniref:sodium/potassium/calcium exchanger 1-like n=1 Tax=Hetaerina americana TaxID=62018 RepID=UPI003A7F3553